MKIINTLLIISTLFLSFSLKAIAFDHSHAKWTKVLQKYQDSKSLLVNYALLKYDTSKDAAHDFNTYLADLQAVSVAKYAKWSSNDRKAFLINAYNSLTWKLIIDHYPVKSIKDIGSILSKPWDKEFFSLLDGKIKSLDPIEHDWLRPMFKDFRIHAAVNCASISCPSLRNEAFVGIKLEDQLDEQMKIWMNDTSKNKYDAYNKYLYLSKIFDWYEDDFVKWGGGVKKVVSKYSVGAMQSYALGAKIKYLDYDWALNSK